MFMIDFISWLSFKWERELFWLSLFAISSLLVPLYMSCMLLRPLLLGIFNIFDFCL